MRKADSGSHDDHHHYISQGLIAAVDGNQVRLSASGASALLFEEEEDRGALSDKNPRLTKARSGRFIGRSRPDDLGLPDVPMGDCSPRSHSCSPRPSSVLYLSFLPALRSATSRGSPAASRPNLLGGICACAI